MRRVIGQSCSISQVIDILMSPFSWIWKNKFKVQVENVGFFIPEKNWKQIPILNMFNLQPWMICLLLETLLQDSEEPTDKKYYPDGGYIPRIIFVGKQSLESSWSTTKHTDNNFMDLCWYQQLRWWELEFLKHCDMA